MTENSLFIDIVTGENKRQEAGFALRLTSIGVCEPGQRTKVDYAARLLNRQADFIAMLPALGCGNAVELRFIGQPAQRNPALGRVEVYMRVRVSGSDKASANRQAETAYRELLPNLLSISDSYHWEPVADEAAYRRVFSDFKSQYLAELMQREALVSLERVGLLPHRRSIGFAQPTCTPEEAIPQEDAVVHFTFPFIRSFDRLDRLFSVLLMQTVPVAVSIALSPTNLRSEELDFLAQQMQQCERYLQLPLAGPISQPSAFLPPLKAQARTLLEGIQRLVFGLRDDCFLLKIQAASPEPIAPALMEALGVSITEHVASTDAESDARHDSTLFAGGYDWVVPENDNAMQVVRENFERITFTQRASALASSAGVRLRSLVTSRQANAAFRLPIPLETDFPGLDTRLYRSVPPPVNLPGEGTFVGENFYLGLAQPVHLLRDDRRRHAYIVGQTGTGKSSLLLNMIMQDICNGEGVGVLDPHGELIDQILPRIPQDRIKDVVYINPEKQDFIAGLNILEYRDDLDKDSAVNHLLEIFDKLYNMREAGGPIFEMYLRNSALLVMADPTETATLADIMRVFLDKDYRKQKLSRCSDVLVCEFWRNIAEQMSGSDWSLPNMAAYVNSKFARLIYNSLIRNIVLQEHSTIDFLDLMNHRRILLVDLCKGKLGETNSAFLGMILISLLQRAAFSRSGNTDLADFYLYVDEFQNLATESFTTLLSEARKYHLNLVLTNQYLHQIPEEIRDAVVGNVGTLISFRVGMKDAKELEQEYRPAAMQSDLMNLPNYHAYVTTLIQGEVTKPFNIRTRLDETPVDSSAAQSVMECRVEYARPKDEVETSITERWSGEGD